MKSIKLTFFKTLIIIISFIGIKICLDIYSSKYLRNDRELLLKESVNILNNCFDLENKNRRSPKQSIELIEYCLNEYGYKN